MRLFHSARVFVRVWSWAFVFCAALDVFATPAQVILIRHAEKNQSGSHLSLKGRQRAAALVPTFLGAPYLLHFGPPAAIYLRKASTNAPAVRWAQTVINLADELGIPIKGEYSKTDAAALVEEIMQSEEYEGKMVLVCWSHGGMPKLAELFGAKKAPKKWTKNVYDRFWILTFSENGDVAFEDRPQKLLYGDSTR